MRGAERLDGRQRRSWRRFLRWSAALSLLGVLVVLVSCGQAPEPQEGCDLPFDHSHDHALSERLSVLSSSMACGPGTLAEPPARSFNRSPEGYTSYVGQTRCDPTAKPGVVAFRDMVRKTYPCTGDYGISRACSQGSTSEHKEGRAWDWKLNYPHPAATNLLAWLLATDNQGNKHAMARRVGIMYMIWNRKIWKAYQASKGWQAYTGASPHTDHVHFSFSWDGANKKTSFWTGTEDTCKPAAEVCDGKDNNCDGKIDDGNPGGGKACSTGKAAPCDQGTSQCTGGKIVCQPKNTPSAELCNGKDDDCNGKIDDGNPGGGKPCSTGKAAPCDQGIGECKGGKIVCHSSQPVFPESCNGKDDNCDGQIDEGNPGGGQACDTGIAGVPGKAICVNGQLSCQPQGTREPPVTRELTGQDAGQPDPGGSGPDTTGRESAKKQLGEEGCSHSTECATGLCAKIGDVARCVQRCTDDAQCPAGYECKGGQACWPKVAVDLGDKGNKCGSKLNLDDPSCSGLKPNQVAGSGCRCSVHEDSPPPWEAVFLMSLVLLWFLRLKPGRVR